MPVSGLGLPKDITYLPPEEGKEEKQEYWESLAPGVIPYEALLGATNLDELASILQSYIDTGKIAESQAYDIFEEWQPYIRFRSTKPTSKEPETLRSLMNKPEFLEKIWQQDIERQVEEHKEEALAKRAKFYERPIETQRVIEEAYEGKPEGLAQALEQRQEHVEEREAKRAWAKQAKLPVPEIEYKSLYEQDVEGTRGSSPYKEWFASKFPTIARQFQESKPEEYWTRGGWTRMSRGEEKFLPEEQIKGGLKQDWASYIEQQKPKITQDWWNLGWRERGERPYAYAPKIRTVRF